MHLLVNSFIPFLMALTSPNVSAGTNDHKISGLKTNIYYLTVTEVKRLEVHGSKIRVSSGLSFPETLGRSGSVPFATTRDCLPFLANSHIAPTSACAIASPDPEPPASLNVITSVPHG